MYLVKKYKVLELLAKYHWLWLDFVSKRIADRNFTEDIVQEMYLKAHRTINQDALIIDGEVNKTYIFSMLKNLCNDYNKAKSRVVKQDLESLSEEEYERVHVGMELDQIFEIHERHVDILKSLNDRWWYLKEMYLIRTSAEEPTMREIYTKSGISVTTIFLDCKKIKQIIKETG